MIHVVRMRIADADDGRRERATTKNPQTCLFSHLLLFLLSCREVETGSRLKMHCLRSLASFTGKRIDFARSENRATIVCTRNLKRRDIQSDASSIHYIVHQF